MSGGVFIVPYRDRSDHLIAFVAHYRKIIPEIPIVVVEQNDGKPFNRAKLFNVGFLESPQYSYFILHDVDLLLDMRRSDPYVTYSYPETVIHAGTNLEQFNWAMAYKEFFGGVTIFSKDHMEKLNGWSNLIYSWGIEEDFQRDYILQSGIEIVRRNTYYFSLPHKRSVDSELLGKNITIRKTGRNNDIDGLSNCRYELVSREEKDGYTLIKANL